MESVSITGNGQTNHYKNMADASRALGKKRGFLRRRRQYFGNRFSVDGMQIVIEEESGSETKERTSRKKEKMIREVMNLHRKKPCERKPMKRDGKSMSEIIGEIEAYNRAHGTALTYGQYMARGLNYGRTTNET